MKALLLSCILLMSGNVCAEKPFQHTGILTADYINTSTIEIDNQIFLINNETEIIHFEGGLLSENIIPKGVSIGYEISSDNETLQSISTIWLIRNDE